ncbi:uncharacterized mitochondrial protein AtMg01250-like [Rutidosis leptorrhynchoides]|uniref:uncharacterized mitochondrial protein AtMg01250-like n=1 Tax=Rutidosis leptorrhynchoides TaxID=125765 RepID=UPI003A98D675
MDKISSDVQSAFISGRQILDGPLILSEAYDTVNWQFLDYMMTRIGFGEKWGSWIKMCFCSARSSVIINSSPTDEFTIIKGLRQGDPLSPFLFLIVMEGLHILIKESVDAGLIQGAMVGNSHINVSHLFYADDAVFVSEWNSLNFSNVVRILNSFYRASRLKISIEKSNVYGIGVNQT